MLASYPDYLGMAAIVLSLVGGFSTSFTKKSCEHFFISVPVLKVLAAVASQGVFIFRTYAICNRSRTILIFLLIFGGLVSAAEIIAPVVVPRNAQLGKTGNCISDLSHGSTSWIQYMCGSLFDIVILALTSNRLFRDIDRRLVTGSQFTRVFWESQLMYFLAVTVVNILNLVFFIHFNKSSMSTMFATLGMAVTAIFSVRVILDLNEAANNPKSNSTSGHLPQHQNGTGGHSTYRSPIDRSFRLMSVDETKTDAYRMDNLDPGVHIQREVVVDADQASLTSWDRQKNQRDIKSPAIAL